MSCPYFLNRSTLIIVQFPLINMKKEKKKKATKEFGLLMKKKHKNVHMYCFAPEHF